MAGWLAGWVGGRALSRRSPVSASERGRREVRTNNNDDDDDDDGDNDNHNQEAARFNCRMEWWYPKPCFKMMVCQTVEVYVQQWVQHGPTLPG